jgi:hypothetical protein
VRLLGEVVVQGVWRLVIDDYNKSRAFAGDTKEEIRSA